MAKRRRAAGVTWHPRPWIGKQVTVTISSVPMDRAGFHSQINVEGTLEKHSQSEHYRVVVSDGTYTYFEPKDIEAIIFGVELAEQEGNGREGDVWTTRTGSEAVIYLKGWR